MNEFDENGWSHIHQAAFRGFVKSVERFVSAGEDQLELETQDSLKSTPFLLAVMSGNIETVECLVSLGAKIDCIDNQNNGAVELCSFNQSIHLLEYFIALNSPVLPVWKRLVRFMSSDLFEESESASKCICMMTNPKEPGQEPMNWEAAHDNDIVQTIAKVNRSNLEDVAKTASLRVMLNLSQVEIIREQAVKNSILQSLVQHLKSPTAALVEMAAKNISVFAREDSYADQLVQGNVIPAMVKVLNTAQDVGVLIEVARAVGVIADDRSNHQQTIGNANAFISGIHALFNDLSDKDLLLALLDMCSKLCQGNSAMQHLLTAGDIGTHCITLMRVKHTELQLEAVKSIRALVTGNAATAAVLLHKNAVNSLMQLLRKHEREPPMTEQTVLTLWAIAGNDLDEQMNVSAQIGVSLLVDFLKATQDFEKLNYIGCECLGVLAQGPRNKCEQIAAANGVAKLVVLLSSANESIVLSAIRTLRYLCVGVAYITNPANQTALSDNNGLKYLLSLLTRMKEGSDLIRVEACLTLASATLGHPTNYAQLMAMSDFNYVRLLRLIYHDDPDVRVKAGAALATFSYNSLHNQNQITMHGGLRFACFEDFLKSNNEFYRCNVAFQVVVLSRIISDEEQAISSAAGIRLVVDLLKGSKCDQILALAADIVARLCHVRAGIPSAFVSINTVEILAMLLRHKSDQVRGCSAIALSYLSYNPFGQRQLLNCCRKDPALMKVLLFYKGKISGELLDGWKHYEIVGLRPTSEIMLKENAISAEFRISPRHTTSLGNPDDLLTSSGVLDNTGQTFANEPSAGLRSRSSQTPFRMQDNGDLARLLSPGDDQMTSVSGGDVGTGSVALSLLDQDCVSLCSADTDISHTVAPHIAVQEY